jgi:hypothetical protein
MFRLASNHHQASHIYLTKYILACIYITGSHIGYSYILISIQAIYVPIMQTNTNMYLFECNWPGDGS